MSIPQIRARLHELAKIHHLPELAELAEATRRAPPSRPRSPDKSIAVSPKLRAQLRHDALANPDKSLQEIGARRGVNIGRVSEALK
jgi:hypothetical protein